MLLALRVRGVLAVVLAREDEDLYYVVTARDADRRERRDYRREVEQID